MGRRFWAASTFAFVVCLIWLGWSGKQVRDEVHAASRHAVRVAELRGTVAYLDDWMTMSAQLAVRSGESRWTDRFEEAAPKLDAAIAEAANLTTPEARAAFASTTGEAHRDLVTMERQALALAAAGDLASATALLNGPEFEYLQNVYATGIDMFGQELSTLSDARAAELSDKAWIEAAGFGLGALLIVSAALSVRGRLKLKGALARIAVASRTDTLTELPNRRRFHEELAAPWTSASEGSPALLLIDLDRFKATNDAYGHPAGDELLQLSAARLRRLIRKGDFIARLGSDEFGLLVGRGDGALFDEELSSLAKRIVRRLAEPFVLSDGTTVQIGASIGVVRVDADCGQASRLMQCAEVALRAAKADGQGCFRVFQPGMDAEARSRALLEAELRQAIIDDAIVPHYQPLVSLKTGALIGCEMLARWPHPSRGMVSPVEFIPIAEDIGLIGAMTERLLAQACKDAAAWSSPIVLACNISPLHLRDPALPGMLRTVLESSRLPADRLELEITESALVGDIALARGLLDQLKGLGVRLALDDFGTGYSSLRHLQVLPFDKIKIDRSFVASMATDVESGKIVSAVIGLSQSLGLETVAEGIETEDVAGLLRALGCDVGQGWLFGRPCSVEHFNAWLSMQSLPPEMTSQAA